MTPDSGPEQTLPDLPKRPLLPRVAAFTGLLVILAGTIALAGIEDGPDGFPTVRGGRKSVEVFHVQPPLLLAGTIYSQYCTDSDTECRKALTKACQQQMHTTSPIEFAAYNFDGVDKTCKGTCPDGTRITCTVQPVNQKPTPKPIGPGDAFGGGELGEAGGAW